MNCTCTRLHVSFVWLSWIQQLCCFSTNFPFCFITRLIDGQGYAEHKEYCCKRCPSNNIWAKIHCKAWSVYCFEWSGVQNAVLINTHTRTFSMYEKTLGVSFNLWKKEKSYFELQILYFLCLGVMGDPGLSHVNLEYLLTPRVIIRNKARGKCLLL